MSNNKSIQILRSNSSYDTTTSTEKLLDGQPYISKQLNKLMFGDGTKTLAQKYTTESSIDLHPNLENSIGKYSLHIPYYGDNVDGKYFPSRAEVVEEDGEEQPSFGVALGLSNILRGQFSLVTGRLNTDVGANNLTGGLYNEVYQNHNITSGQQNKNYGKRSLVVGYQNILGTVNSSPEGNIVAGQLNQNITGHFNIISGQSHPQISGESNIVFGQGNTVTSNHNLVGGYGNSVTNERCLVMGSNNTVGKAGNFVFGQNITAKGTAYQTLIGKNFSADDKSLLMVGKDTPLFYIQENQSRFINELVVQNTIRTSNSRFKVSLTGANTIETVGNIKCGASLVLPQISLSTDNKNDYDHLYVSGVNTTNTQLHIKSVYTDTLYSDSLLLRSEKTLSSANMYAATVGQLYEVQENLQDDISELNTSVSEHKTNVATESNLGHIKLLEENDDITRKYGVRLNEDNQAYVNVPWTDTYPTKLTFNPNTSSDGSPTNNNNYVFTMTLNNGKSAKLEIDFSSGITTDSTKDYVKIHKQSGIVYIS